MTAPTVALVGATASGKSAAAHRAAVHAGRTEVVALDALTVYRGMDLGTAKPTQAERAEVRYHLLDVLDASEELSVRSYQAMCVEAMEGIAARGNAALLVGGSGLYHRAVVDALLIPPHDEGVRAALFAEAERPGGLRALYGELEALDPLAASRIGPNNERRVVRALEVIRLTSRPFSSFGDGLERYEDRGAVQVGIRFDPERADAAIAERFHEWLDAGLLDELRGLLAAPKGLSRTARQAAGYRQLLEHLEGTTSLETALYNAVTATRRLARRQWRWFRRDPRIHWVETSDEAVEVLVARLAARREE
jgi:tRNA dimethylallyltransferase